MASQILVQMALLAALTGTPRWWAAVPAVPVPPAEEPVALLAKGTFEVKLTPVPMTEGAGTATMARQTIAKLWHGDLEGTSAGEMLAAMSPVQGSAGYVAVERVTGVLHGKRGSFVLQHTGVMTRGTPSLVVTVVPDSGTDELAGMTGMLKIIIEKGKHFYELEYSLSAAPGT